MYNERDFLMGVDSNFYRNGPCVKSTKVYFFDKKIRISTRFNPDGNDWINEINVPGERKLFLVDKKLNNLALRRFDLRER